eukprot:355099-Chlamydomonas_euryale.AAC.4
MYDACMRAYATARAHEHARSHTHTHTAFSLCEDACSMGCAREDGKRGRGGGKTSQKKRVWDK